MRSIRTAETANREGDRAPHRRRGRRPARRPSPGRPTSRLTGNGFFSATIKSVPKTVRNMPTGTVRSWPTADSAGSDLKARQVPGQDGQIPDRFGRIPKTHGDVHRRAFRRGGRQYTPLIGCTTRETSPLSSIAQRRRCALHEARLVEASRRDAHCIACDCLGHHLSQLA